MKAVMLSIKPKYCELIASDRKTIEVRKTRPKIETPFKCYIYCTKEFYRKGDGYFQGKYCGKVIGEFICNEIQEIKADNLVALYFNNPFNETCVTDLEMRKYANGKNLFLWYISNLAIYDEPKELSEFGKECNLDCPSVHCPYWEYQRVNADEWDYDCSCNNIKPLTRPPQSWCYVVEGR